MFSRYMSTILLRRCNSNFSCVDTVRNVHFFSPNHVNIYSRFKWCSCKMNMWLRDQSIQIAKVCTRQFEFIAAQRIRRSGQIFHLYTKIWDEVALKEFIKSWRRRVSKNAKDFLFSAVGVTVYNWDKDRIGDQDLYCYSQEIEKIHRLHDSTVVCPECHLRLIVDVYQAGIQYCKCPKTVRGAQKAQQKEIEWEPFIERQDMIVWRREEKDYGGLYAYKVYGSFDDVSAADFLQVQIDIDYRREWDVTVKELQIVDTDPFDKESLESGSDIIYWEMVWPRMFSNRDYVYQRRWIYDKSKNIIIIVSKETEHPNVSDRPDTYRVKTYWSYMVIKPRTDFHKPGIEFGLTYFDDPGVNIPSAVTAWVAIAGFPDYLYRMRQAAKDYKNYRALQEAKNVIPETVTIADSQNDIEDQMNVNIKQSTETNNQENTIVFDNLTNKTGEENLKNRQSLQSQNIEKSINDNEEEDEENNESDSTEEDKGFFDYFFLAKLFA